jgi:hypothetical protein
MSGWLGPLIQGATSLYGAYTANQAGQRQQQAAQQAAAMQQQTTQQALTQQQGATDQQLNLLTQIYNQQRQDGAPYRAAGQQGIGQFAAQVGNGFQQSPGYQWTQDEAMRGVMANQSARGLVNSGSTLRALQDRSANLANQEYGNYMNRLAALSGIGQTAAGQGMSAGQGYGAQAGNALGQNANAFNSLLTQGVGAGNNYLTQGAGAAASGQVQGANALMGGANALLSYWGNNSNNATGKPGQGWFG